MNSQPLSTVNLPTVPLIILTTNKPFLQYSAVQWILNFRTQCSGKEFQVSFFSIDPFMHLLPKYSILRSCLNIGVRPRIGHSFS